MSKLSCITTVFDDGPDLRRALVSILNQREKAFEFIVVNDGSGPETTNILSEFNDPRLKVIYQKNAGISVARNTGLSVASGQYVCFLDADDTRPLWAFSSLSETIDKWQPDLIFSAGFKQDFNGRPRTFRDDAANMRALGASPETMILPNDKRRGDVYGLRLQMANKVIRRDLIQRHKLSFNGREGEDLPFHIQAISVARSIVLSTTPTFCYHAHYARNRMTSPVNSRRPFETLDRVGETLDIFANGPDVDNPIARENVLHVCRTMLRRCLQSVPQAQMPRYMAMQQSLWDNAHPLFGVMRRDAV